MITNILCTTNMVVLYYSILVISMKFVYQTGALFIFEKCTLKKIRMVKVIIFTDRSKKLALITIVLLMLGFIIIKIIEMNNAQNLCVAIRQEDRKKINKLIESSWNTNSLSSVTFLQFAEITPTTPMSEACRMSDIETIKHLMEKGALVNRISGDFSSPLHNATDNYGISAYGGRPDYEILKLLLENGADPNISIRGYYPLLNICDQYVKVSNSDTRRVDEEEYLRAIKLLIEYEADVSVTQYKENVVHKLAKNNNLMCLEYFLDNYEFDINLLNDSGQTALIKACDSEFGGLECVQLLIDRGIDKTIKDNSNKTAYDYAKERRNIELMKLLLE